MLYDAFKSVVALTGVIALSEALALYLKPLGIGVTCLCPGPVRTGLPPPMSLPFFRYR